MVINVEIRLWRSSIYNFDLLWRILLGFSPLIFWHGNNRNHESRTPEQTAGQPVLFAFYN